MTAHGDDLALAHRMADVADRIAAHGFTGRPLPCKRKADGSPVSPTDVAVESEIRAIVAGERPDDAFVGEEVGSSGDGRRRWVVDGIDGTVNFVAGDPGWSTLIALEEDGRPVIGVSSSVALGRRWWASRGAGAWTTPLGGGVRQVQRLSVTRQAVLRSARCTLIAPLAALEGDGLALAWRLTGRCTYVDPVGHGAVMVANGDVDACLQIEGHVWDFAALAIIVEEAGGRFSDLGGRWRTTHGGPALFSNGFLHNAALSAMTG